MDTFTITDTARATRYAAAMETGIASPLDSVIRKADGSGGEGGGYLPRTAAHKAALSGLTLVAAVEVV